jgi:hypothetical protein
VRATLLAMLLMAFSPRAEACPHGTVCVSAGTRVQAAAEIARPRSMLHIAIRQAERAQEVRPRLEASLKTHVVPQPPAIEMPWIWVQLRTTVYSKLPRYDRVDRHVENHFSLVLSPVVVSSPQDTVPGLGVEGGF